MLVVLAILGIVLAGLDRALHICDAVADRPDETGQRPAGRARRARPAPTRAALRFGAGLQLGVVGHGHPALVLPERAEHDAERQRHPAERDDRASPGRAASTRDEHDLVRLIRHRHVHREDVDLVYRVQRRDAGTYPSGAGVTSPSPGASPRAGRRTRSSAMPRTHPWQARHARAGGVASTAWLVSSSAFTSFTRPAVLVPAPTFSVAASGGTILPGTYTTTSPR